MPEGAWLRGVVGRAIGGSGCVPQHKRKPKIKGNACVLLHRMFVVVFRISRRIVTPYLPIDVEMVELRSNAEMPSGILPHTLKLPEIVKDKP
jgi:hypothetical protein